MSDSLLFRLPRDRTSLLHCPSSLLKNESQDWLVRSTSTPINRFSFPSRESWDWLDRSTSTPNWFSLLRGETVDWLDRSTSDLIDPFSLLGDKLTARGDRGARRLHYTSAEPLAPSDKAIPISSGPVFGERQR